MYLPKDPFPECATHSIDADRVSLGDLSEMFNGRSRSALHGDCQELEVDCTHGVDRDGAWTLYVYMAWYQCMKNGGTVRIHRQHYWDMCTPDHLKGPDVVCGPDTAVEVLREAFVARIGKSYDDFEQKWSKLVSAKKKKYGVTIDV